MTGQLRIFLAGATGAIGRRLVPLLRRAGHHVAGTTRSAAKANALAQFGIDPVVLDVFDRDAVMRAVSASRPDVIVHQLTDLPQAPDPAALAVAIEGNARLRHEGTRNLVEAALAAGVRRIVAQSIAFAYAPGPLPYRESDPLDLAGEGSRGVTASGVEALERLVTGTPELDGAVLRYGRLYGPGTWHDVASGPAPLHVDAAAEAAVLAIEVRAVGIYNVAEDDGTVSIAAARERLGFDPGFRFG